MLDAAMWQAHSLKLPERIKLARLCLQKYKKYVSTKTIGALLFKFLFINHKKRSTMASNIKINSFQECSIPHWPNTAALSFLL